MTSRVARARPSRQVSEAVNLQHIERERIAERHAATRSTGKPPHRLPARATTPGTASPERPRTREGSPERPRTRDGSPDSGRGHGNADVDGKGGGTAGAHGHLSAVTLSRLVAAGYTPVTAQDAKAAARGRHALKAVGLVPWRPVRGRPTGVRALKMYTPSHFDSPIALVISPRGTQAGRGGGRCARLPVRATSAGALPGRVHSPGRGAGGGNRSPPLMRHGKESPRRGGQAAWTPQSPPIIGTIAALR